MRIPNPAGLVRLFLQPPLWAYSVVGLITGPSFSWVAACAMSLVHHHLTNGLGTCAATLHDLGGLHRDYLLPDAEGGPRYHLVETDLGGMETKSDQQVPEIIRTLQHPGRVGTPLILLASKPGQPSYPGFRAYSNDVGQSVIIVHRDPHELIPLDQFFLLHELSHVSIMGAWNNGVRLAEPSHWMAGAIGVGVLGGGNLLPAALFTLLALFSSRQSASGGELQRELHADYEAFWSLDPAIREEVASDFVSLCGDHVSMGDRNQRIYWGLRKRQMDLMYSDHLKGSESKSMMHGGYAAPVLISALGGLLAGWIALTSTGPSWWWFAFVALGIILTWHRQSPCESRVPELDYSMRARLGELLAKPTTEVDPDDAS